MKTIRFFVFTLLIGSIAACSLVSTSTEETTISNPASTLSQTNPTESPIPNQADPFPLPSPNGTADFIFANGTIIPIDDANPNGEFAILQEGNNPVWLAGGRR